MPTRSPTPWDLPPKPAEGDAAKTGIWTAVGAALSAWGEYESELGRLFTICVTWDYPSPQLMRAFGAVRTFEGRRDMLRGASEGFFSLNRWASSRQAAMKEIIREGSKAFERRNELAHGIVMPFRPEGSTEPAGFCLMPSYYDMKKRQVHSGLPDYSYTAANIEVFRAGFEALARPPHELANHLIREIRERRRGRSLPQWPV